MDLLVQWKAKSCPDTETTLTIMKERAQLVLLNQTAPFNGCFLPLAAVSCKREWPQEAALPLFPVVCLSRHFVGHNLGFRLSVLGSI